MSKICAKQKPAKIAGFFVYAGNKSSSDKSLTVFTASAADFCHASWAIASCSSRVLARRNSCVPNII